MSPYHAGQLVRVLGGGGPSVGEELRVLIADHDGTVWVDWGDDGWWLEDDEVEPVDTAPATQEQLAMSHVKAWRKLTARTPRERLLAGDWTINEDGDWVGVFGQRVEIDGGVAWFYGFECEDGDVCGLDIRTLRDFAAVAEETVEVTP